MPVGRTEEEKRWFKGWFDVVIRPAVVKAGLEPVLAAVEEHPSAINDAIRAHLVFDPMIVVDLGGTTKDDLPNPNVMYELGLRHAFGSPTVIMAWDGQTLPFDISNQRAILSSRDFADIEATITKLTRFLENAKKGEFYNPMEAVRRTASIDATLALNRDSMLAALASEIKELRENITTVPISAPKNIPEKIIYYNSTANREGDFVGIEGQIWKDGKAISGRGTGVLSVVDPEIMNLERTNSEGKYEIYLKSYIINDKRHTVIPKSEFSRRIHVSCEMRAVTGEHSARVVVRNNEKHYNWLGNMASGVISSEWKPIQGDFTIPPTVRADVRIDHERASQIPSAMQFRKLLVTEI